MLSEPIRVANTREHISWSHRFALFWLALSLVLFGGAYALAEIGEMSDTNRTLMFVMLGTIRRHQCRLAGCRIGPRSARKLDPATH